MGICAFISVVGAVLFMAAASRNRPCVLSIVVSLAVMLVPIGAIAALGSTSDACGVGVLSSLIGLVSCAIENNKYRSAVVPAAFFGLSGTLFFLSAGLP